MPLTNPAAAVAISALSFVGTRRCRLPILFLLLSGFLPLFFDSAGSTQYVRHRVIALLAGVFEYLSVLILAHGKGRLPWDCIHVRVFDSDFVLDRVGVYACEAFNHAQRFAYRDAFYASARHVGGDPTFVVVVR